MNEDLMAIILVAISLMCFLYALYHEKIGAYKSQFKLYNKKCQKKKTIFDDAYFEKQERDIVKGLEEFCENNKD